MNYDTFTIEDDEPETLQIAPEINHREANARQKAREFEERRFEELHWPKDEKGNKTLGCSAWRARRQAKAEAQEVYQACLEKGRTAKDLARDAGLLPEGHRETREVRKLIEWFRQSAMPFLESCIARWSEEDGQQDKADIEAYYESRKARYRFNRQVWHQRRGDHNDHGLGLYSWRKDGKFYRSWLGNEPLATPRQIAAKLLARYPGSEITIIHTGWSNTNTSGAALIGGITVPTYEVFVSPMLPRAALAGERLYLDHGRCLDMEDAEGAEAQLRSGQLDAESYADFIARLCREAPSCPDWNDYQAGQWEELSEDGEGFKTFNIDDTRDDQRLATYEGMFAGRDTWSAVDTGNRIWDDESTTFGSIDFGSDQDSGRDVQILLGLSTQQIEHAFGEVGDDATIGDFLKALPRREASESKKEALRKPDEDAITF